MIKSAEIIQLSWNIYISKFKKYLPLIGVSFGAYFISGIINILLEQVQGLNTILRLLISIGVSILVSLIGFLITILIILYTDRFLHNKKIDDIKLKDALSIFWQALWVAIIAGAITVLGYFLFLIPGIIFTVWYAFVLYLIILEKKQGIQVLKESKELSKKRFWEVFWRILLPTLFWGIISYLVLAGLVNILSMIMNIPILNIAEVGIGIQIAIITIAGLVSTFFMPLYLIIINILFRELKK